MLLKLASPASGDQFTIAVDAQVFEENYLRFEKGRKPPEVEQLAADVAARRWSGSNDAKLATRR